MTVVSRAMQRCSRSERVGGSEPRTSQLALQGLQKTSSSLRFSVFCQLSSPLGMTLENIQCHLCQLFSLFHSLTEEVKLSPGALQWP